MTKTVLSLRKQLTLLLLEGHFGPTNYNNIGTFEQIFYERR